MCTTTRSWRRNSQALGDEPPIPPMRASWQWAGSGPFFAIPPPFGVQVYQTEGLALFTHLRGRTILRSSSNPCSANFGFTEF